MSYLNLTKNNGKRFNFRGFTLIESLITIIIVGLLASLAVYKLSQHIERARTNFLKTSITMMDSGIERAIVVDGSFPDITAETFEGRLEEILGILQEKGLFVNLTKEYNLDGYTPESLTAAMIQAQVNTESSDFTAASIIKENKIARGGLESGDPLAEEILVLPLDGPIVYPERIVLRLNNPGSPDKEAHYEDYWRLEELDAILEKHNNGENLTEGELAFLLENALDSGLTTDTIAGLIESGGLTDDAREALLGDLLTAIKDGSEDYTDEELYSLLGTTLEDGGIYGGLDNVDLTGIDLSQLDNGTLVSLAGSNAILDEEQVDYMMNTFFENGDTAVLTALVGNDNTTDAQKAGLVEAYSGDSALNLDEINVITAAVNSMEFIDGKTMEDLLACMDNTSVSSYGTRILESALTNANKATLTEEQTDALYDATMSNYSQNCFMALGNLDLSEENKGDLLSRILDEESSWYYYALRSEPAIDFSDEQLDALVTKAATDYNKSINESLLYYDGFTEEQYLAVVEATLDAANGSYSDINSAGLAILSNSAASDETRKALIDYALENEDSMLTNKLFASSQTTSGFEYLTGDDITYILENADADFYNDGDMGNLLSSLGGNLTSDQIDIAIGNIEEYGTAYNGAYRYLASNANEEQLGELIKLASEDSDLDSLRNLVYGGSDALTDAQLDSIAANVINNGTLTGSDSDTVNLLSALIGAGAFNNMTEEEASALANYESLGSGVIRAVLDADSSESESLATLQAEIAGSINNGTLTGYAYVNYMNEEALGSYLETLAGNGSGWGLAYLENNAAINDDTIGSYMDILSSSPAATSYSGMDLYESLLGAGSYSEETISGIINSGGTSGAVAASLAGSLTDWSNFIIENAEDPSATVALNYGSQFAVNTFSSDGSIVSRLENATNEELDSFVAAAEAIAASSNSAYLVRLETLLEETTVNLSASQKKALIAAGISEDVLVTH